MDALIGILFDVSAEAKQRQRPCASIIESPSYDKEEGTVDVLRASEPTERKEVVPWKKCYKVADRRVPAAS